MSRVWRRLLCIVAALALPAMGPGTALAGDASGINIRLPDITGTLVTGVIKSAATGDPIQGAAAMLVHADEGWILMGQSTTNANGRYRIIAPEWGWDDYYLRIETPGQAGLPDGWYASSAPGKFVAAEADATIVAVGDTDVTGLNVTVPQGGGIRGHVTKASNADPVQDAAVVLSLDGDYVTETYTDSTGFYRFRGLAAADYEVYVQRPPGSVLQSGCYRAASPGGFTDDCSQASQVAVDGGTVAGIDVALPRGLTIQGRVTTRTGTEICPSVYAIPEDQFAAATRPQVRRLSRDATRTVRRAASGASDQADRLGRQAQVGRAGRSAAEPAGFGAGCFPIRGLTPGQYRVYIEADYDPFGTLNIVDGFYSSANGNQWSQNAGTVIDLTEDVNLGTISPAKGKVITGRVRTVGGDPIRRLDVLVTDAGGDWAGGQATTDRDGRFRISSLAPGDYRVYFFDQQDRGYQCVWYRQEAARGTTTKRGSATLLTLGPDASGVDARLTKQTYDITGKLMDADGNGIFGFVLAESLGGSLPLDCRYGSGGVNDDAGRFRVEHLMPGTYRLLAIVFDTGSESGWYRQGVPGNFTPDMEDATPITVGQ